jgi:hypothetical protein
MRFVSLERVGIDPEEVRKLYRELKSLRKTAEKVGVSYVTVKYVVGDEVLPVGVVPLPYDWQGNGRTHRFKKWHDAHLGKLPHSPSKVWKMYGQNDITPNAIECYMRRRASLIKRYLKSLGDLRELPDKYLIDSKGREIPLGMVDSYDIKVDKYNLIVEIKMVLRFGGATTAHLSVQQYIALFKGEADAQRIAREEV